MKTTAEILDILRDFKAHYAEKYGIITLGLFGSAARGEHDENSDIDICIKLQEPNYFIILDIKEDLEKILSTKVDVISLGAIMRNFFRKSLEQDAIYIKRKNSRNVTIRGRTRIFHRKNHETSKFTS